MLRLHDNQLSGSIPTQLGSLSKVTVLYLDRNQLTGSIPTELGNMSSLVWVDLFVQPVDRQCSGEPGYHYQPVMAGPQRYQC